MRQVLKHTDFFFSSFSAYPFRTPQDSYSFRLQKCKMPLSLAISVSLYFFLLVCPPHPATWHSSIFLEQVIEWEGTRYLERGDRKILFNVCLFLWQMLWENTYLKTLLLIFNKSLLIDNKFYLKLLMGTSPPPPPIIASNKKQLPPPLGRTRYYYIVRSICNVRMRNIFV